MLTWSDSQSYYSIILLLWQDDNILVYWWAEQQTHREACPTIHEPPSANLQRLSAEEMPFAASTYSMSAADEVGKFIPVRLLRWRYILFSRWLISTVCKSVSAGIWLWSMVRSEHGCTLEVCMPTVSWPANIAACWRSYFGSQVWFASIDDSVVFVIGSFSEHLGNQVACIAKMLCVNCSWTP